MESSTKYNVDLIDESCTCGEWQEHGYPCVDALAYFRLEKKITLNDVVASHVSHLYTYANARELLRVNIIPVCMDTVKPDGVTLPPKQSLKRSSGRPRKQRIRKRSRFAENPEQSTVVCSKCKKRGHNIKTCDTRAWMEKRAEGKNKDNDGSTIEDDTNQLDIS